MKRIVLTYGRHEDKDLHVTLAVDHIISYRTLTQSGQHHTRVSVRDCGWDVFESVEEVEDLINGA